MSPPPTPPPHSPTLASRPPLHPHAAAAAPSPAASPSRAANPRRPGRSAPSLLLLRSARMLLQPRAPHRRATPPAPRTLASPATEPLLGPRLKPGDGRRIQQQCWWRPPWRRRRPGGGRHKWRGWWRRSSGLPRDGGGALAGAARGMVPRRRDQVVGAPAARPRGAPSPVPPRSRSRPPAVAGGVDPLPPWPAQVHGIHGRRGPPPSPLPGRCGPPPSPLPGRRGSMAGAPSSGHAHAAARAPVVASMAGAAPCCLRAQGKGRLCFFF